VLGSVDGVCWSLPVSDVAATFTTGILFWFEMRKFKRMGV